MQALQATLHGYSFMTATGTVPTNTASSASNHPPTPVPVWYENLSGVVSCPEKI